MILCQAQVYSRSAQVYPCPPHLSLLNSLLPLKITTLISQDFFLPKSSSKIDSTTSGRTSHGNQPLRRGELAGNWEHTCASSDQASQVLPVFFLLSTASQTPYLAPLKPVSQPPYFPLTTSCLFFKLTWIYEDPASGQPSSLHPHWEHGILV